VGHSAGSDLTGLEALGDELRARHEADGRRGIARRTRHLHERGHHVVVQGARIDLADAIEHAGEAEVVGHRPLQSGQRVRIPIEQVQHVLGRTHRTLDPAQRIALDQVVEPVVGDEHLVGPDGEALAEGRHLRRHIVRAPSHRRLGVLHGQSTQSRQCRHNLVADEQQGVADEHLLDVLGEITARHALVDVLVAGECVELLDARLDIMARHALAIGDGAKVDVVDDARIVGDHAVGDVDTEVRLGAEDGEPQAPLSRDPVLRRPQCGHRRGGVALGEDVGDHVHILPDAGRAIDQPRCRCGGGSRGGR
jgi:hypothetical protein